MEEKKFEAKLRSVNEVKFPLVKAAFKGKDGNVYIGMMLMYCNLLIVPLTVFAIVMLHLQILQEERYLEKAFGTAYREYKRHTFRYLGWR